MVFTKVLAKLSDFENALCIVIIALLAVVAALSAYVFATRRKNKKAAAKKAEDMRADKDGAPAAAQSGNSGREQCAQPENIDSPEYLQSGNSGREQFLQPGNSDSPEYLQPGNSGRREYPAANPDFFEGAIDDDGEIPTVFGEISAAEEAGETEIPSVAPLFAPDKITPGLESEVNAMRYNRSFRARLIQSGDELKEWYGSLKNEILSYGRVTSRISWKYESFSYRRNAVAKLFIKGKTLCLYLALNPADYAGSKFTLEDESEFSQFKDTPALYRIKSEKRVRYAAELIADVCARLQTTKTDREPVDYYEPYNGTLALIKKGLIKRVIENAETSIAGNSFNRAQDENMSDGED